MNIVRIIFLSLIFTLSCQGKPLPLPTVDYVDVEQYIGKWYAISALPQFFTRNCLAQTAEYEIINDETISVLNTCLKKKGKKTTINGKAVIINKESNAELIVTFDNFFTRLFNVKGDYNIIKLDDLYDFVIVGTKDRSSLWIMSRNPTMPEEVLEEYIAFAQQLGYPTDKLIRSQF